MKKLIIVLLILISFISAKAQTTEPFLPPVYKSRVFKLDFFAPLTGNLTFGYEQPLMNNITLDGEIGIIGISTIDDALHPAGFFLKAGPKLYFSPDYLLEGMKRYNDFQGSFFKPEIIYSGFAFDYQRLNSATGFYYTDRGSNHSIALMLNFGKQWVIGKLISLETYAGMGYSFSVVNADDSGFGGDELVLYKYSHA